MTSGRTIPNFRSVKQGFQITMQNGITVSVTWQPGTHSSNRMVDRNSPSELFRTADPGVDVVEIALWNDDSGFLTGCPMFGKNMIGTYMTITDFMNVLNWAWSQPDTPEPNDFDIEMERQGE